MSNVNKFWIPTKAVVDADCRGLIGSKINVKTRLEECLGIVAGVDPYIGISIVREDKHDYVLRCLKGPFSPDCREGYLKDEDARQEYEPKFFAYLDELRHCIKTGKTFNTENLNTRIGYYLEEAGLKRELQEPGMGSCPFGV